MARLKSAGQGALSRLGIRFNVLLASALALAAVLMVNWLVSRPGTSRSFDLTEKEQNQLSTATRGVLDRLPGRVTIDVFFRLPDEQVLRPVAGAAMDRCRRLLGLYRHHGGGNVEIRDNDMTDRELIESRRSALKLRGIEPCLVLSYMGEREVVPVNGGLAVFEPDRTDPDRYQARIQTPRRDEHAITRALQRVTRGQELSAYFMAGHGELALGDTTQFGLDSLHSLLQEEGVRVGIWNPNDESDRQIPDDCSCLSILNPVDKITDEVIDQIEEYVRAGGRLVVAPPSRDQDLERSNLNELLGRFDLDVLDGVVCQPLLEGEAPNQKLIEGSGSVAQYLVMPANMVQHPLIEPIQAAGRAFLVSASKPVRLTRQPANGTASALFRSHGLSWVDYQPNDWRLDPNEGGRKRHDMGVASHFRVGGATSALEEKTAARIVLIGSSFAFTNAAHGENYDLLRNVYNWVLDREYQLSITQRPPDVRLWPLEEMAALDRFNRFAWLYLPLLCALLGIAVAWRRGNWSLGRRSAR